MDLIIDNRKIFEDFEMERSKKMTSLCSDSSYSEADFVTILNAFNRKEPEINKALNYAKTLDFSKNHLKSSYLSHPLRLASFLVQIYPDINSDYIVIALLHNVPETTEITSGEITKIFGDTVGSGIETLVVNRKAKFSTIQESYYNELFAKGTSLILVKLIDKIDNLFVLCLNPDDVVRKEYIEEIKEKLLPFAYKYNANLGQYLDSLLAATTTLGYSKILREQLTAYQQSNK
jgi:(p)ppGpp synthase/HD superfamily hydrolase